jgi:hypothetical protein
MVGFDPAGVKREFGISDRLLPVMLLTVGYAAPGNWPRKPRLGVDDVLSFNQSEPDLGGIGANDLCKIRPRGDR